MKIITTTFACLLALSSFGKSAEANSVHPEVDQALKWELPVNECSKPKLIVKAANLVDGGGSDFMEGAGSMTDVDSHTIKRYERKQKRWEKCVEKYKSELMIAFARLKDSAQYGLTRAQADIILASMAEIQRVYLSPEGLPDKKAASSN
ncbi:MAG: hypothetical protein CMP89_14490 [Gammaproteobacteria bacterium]|nr:hypothetical protein [Gammaproteobacteria bacterium]